MGQEGIHKGFVKQSNDVLQVHLVFDSGCGGGLAQNSTMHVTSHRRQAIIQWLQHHAASSDRARIDQSAQVLQEFIRTEGLTITQVSDWLRKGDTILGVKAKQ